MDKYEELKFIGGGNYGTAHLVRERSSGGRFVVKKIPIELLGQKEKAQAFREVELLAKLKHPNVVEYKESFVGADVIHIVMAYCDGGDLAARIRERAEARRHFDLAQILDWFVQMALAIKYLHEQRVLHRDLKTSNVFLTKENVVKLGDFGIAKTLDSTLDQARTMVGTPYYLSPEVCESKPYSYASDVWALGCVLYELVALRHAFDAPNILTLILKIVQQDFAPIPQHYDPRVLELLRRLLNKAPEQRPTMDEILALPFIRSHMQGLVASGGSLRANPSARRPAGAIRRRVHPKSAPRRASGERRRLRGGAESPSKGRPAAVWMPIAPHRREEEEGGEEEVEEEEEEALRARDDEELELLEASALEESQLNLRPPERSITPEPLLADAAPPSGERARDGDAVQRRKLAMAFSPIAPAERGKVAAWGEGPSAGEVAEEVTEKEVEEEEEGEDASLRFHAEAQELMDPNFQSEYSEECLDGLQSYYGARLAAHRRGGGARWGRRRGSSPRSPVRSLGELSLGGQLAAAGDAEDAESVAASLSESGILRELELEAESSDDAGSDGDSSVGGYAAEENFYSDDSDFYADDGTQYSDDFDDSDAEIIEYADDEFAAEGDAEAEGEGGAPASGPRSPRRSHATSPGLRPLGSAGAPASPVGKWPPPKPATEVQWVMRAVAQSLKESGESAA